MIPLGCSGSCQDKEMLFLDVRSFLIVMTGDGAVEKEQREGIVGGHKSIQLGRVVKKSRERREQANAGYHCSNLWQESTISISKALEY